MTLEQRLKEIGERAEKATPGGWKYFRENGLMVIQRDNGSRVYVCGRDGPLLCMAEVDARFTAHARADIPFLLEALQKALGALEKYADGTGPLWDDRGMGPDCGFVAEKTLADLEKLAGER